MSVIRLTRAAENDLREIAIYTLDHWGEEQSLPYLDNVEACFESLLANSKLGRPCEHLSLGLRR